MAKQMPPVSFEHMEKVLGYKISVSESAQYKRFYSDLTTVPSEIYERTKREFEEYLRTKQSGQVKTKPERRTPQAETRYTTTGGRCAVVFGHTDCTELYCFSADVYCDFNFHLPLQLTKDEGLGAMSIAKMPRGNTHSLSSPLYNLPREIRDKIFAHAIPKIDLQVFGAGDLYGIEFARGTGDPSGFYFPFRSVLGVLSVDRRMRYETLPLAYRKTSIHLGNMDDFIRFAIVIGEVGRENIESISFTWESPSDTASDEEGNYTTGFGDIALPKLHSVRCVQLLRCFTRLKYLRLYFENDLLSTLSLTDFETDQGICRLPSLDHIESIDILNQFGEPADQHQGVKWVKEAIRSAKHNDGASIQLECDEGEKATQKSPVRQ